MTVYSSRRNIKRDRYCKRVIIIWRLRYRNTRVFFFSSFTFLHPPSPSFLQSSLFIDLSHLVERTNLQRRRECPSIIREIFEKYTCIVLLYIFFVLEEVRCLCGSTVRFRFRHEPPPWREEHDIPAGGGETRSLLRDQLSSAQPVGHGLKRVCSFAREIQ